MTGKVSITREKLDMLANAVAAKTDVPVEMTLDEMSEALLNMSPPKSDPVLQSKTVTPTSKKQTITPDANYDGLSSVTVLAADFEPALQSKTVTPTDTEQTIKPDSNYDGLSSVTVLAADLEPNLQNKTVTPAGNVITVYPDVGYDGLGVVTVNAIPYAYGDDLLYGTVW